MSDATITVDNLGEIRVVHISGQLDESNVDEKIQEVYKVVEEVPNGLKLLVDLGGLEYMNSKSIGYLTDLYGKISETGGQVVIAQAAANIVDILQVVGLTQLIKNFATIDEAKEELGGGETAPVEPTPEPTPEVAPVAPEPVVAPVAPEPVVAPVAPEPVVAPTPEPAPIAEPTPTPAIPEAPVVPEAPIQPVVPEAPVQPVAPVAPEAPVQPVAPVAPVAPAPEPTAPPTEEGTYHFEQ